MGSETIVFAVVPSDEEHITMLELEKQWLKNKQEKIPGKCKEMPEELKKYYSEQGCYEDCRRLNPIGKRVMLMSNRSYNNQTVDLAKLPEGTIHIDLIASY